MAGWEGFSGINRGYVLELYERFRSDPNSVDAETRNLFQRWTPPADEDLPAASGAEVPASMAVAAVNLAQSIRRYGHLAAQLDPLGSKPVGDPTLLAERHGLTDDDLRRVPATLVSSPLTADAANMQELVAAFRRVYCSTTGYDYSHVFVPDERDWLRNAAEAGRFREPADPIDHVALLERLTQVEVFERFLHRTFPGKTRFSIEGLDILVPILDEVIGDAAEAGVTSALIGMAHRGRLNVMAHVLCKPYGQILAEFKDPLSSRSFREDMAWSGDVKYHAGAHRAIKDGREMALEVSMPPNPSHLEAIDPIVVGMARAAGTRADRAGAPEFDSARSLAILIHGDAAFIGQGVVAETLNLSRLHGYRTDGTIHIIVNNQIGFTTSDVRDTRSTLYCTDIVKMIEAPVFHVNGDDPEAVCFVTELALDFRMQFQRDVVIDLVCFRRHGHNEQDEPMVTQPLMYKIVSQHPGTRKLYADKLAAQGTIRPEDADEMIKAYRSALDAGYHTNKNILTNFHPPYAVNWDRFKNAKWTDPVETGMPMAALKQLADKLVTIPPQFKLHPRVEKIIADRRQMVEGKLRLDWGMAENLAYAALLKDGFGVRLSGQDTGRGTFFHRHAVLHDQARERWDAGTYIPLQHVAENQPDFLVIDSVLSEEAVMGFEYGYATAEPNDLVVWEGQFGDFANGAQVVIDQFIGSGEVKWGRLCGLTLMLPHGYEGQGPEHSSARLERFLQLCADYNMQICVPSTPAQMFHMLRRQMLRPFRKPLIIMSPKSMLRHKESTSSLEDLAQGRFQSVIGETDELDPQSVRRVVFCSGKIYYDLRAARRERGIKDVAIVRLEQLYPFPHEDYTAQIQTYGKAVDVVWCQEEPGNQGAWHRIQHYLLRHILPHQKLTYALRPSSASPAAGYPALHNEQQKAVIDAALATAV